MVDVKSVEAQLKRIKFNSTAWGKGEIKELPSILCPDEKIYECVNGTYEGGFAMLVATDMRVLLIDKKPLNFLTVEDLRFDMINQIDYNHRLLGASIIINTGYKTLKFTSFNQSRLRKLINHVQDRMSEIKKEQNDHQENQKLHLAAINQQLQAYLIAQNQQLMQLQQQTTDKQPAQLPPLKPSPELADYLFAQSLLQKFGNDSTTVPSMSDTVSSEKVRTETVEPKTLTQPIDELYAEGYQEIFGKAHAKTTQPAASNQYVSSVAAEFKNDLAQLAAKSLEINPLRVAYAKLPMMLRNRKFGRPSYQAHSQSESIAPAQSLQTTA